MRLVQGFAGGLISPQISGLIQSLFRGEERGRAFGLFGATIGVSTAVGPLTGGALIALLPAPTAAERRPQALDPLGVWFLTRCGSGCTRFCFPSCGPKVRLVACGRRHEIHDAILALGCCLVCFRRLSRSLDSSS